MEFSNMMKRCKLSEVSGYLLGLGETLKEREDLSFEKAIRKMESQTENFIDSHFETTEERDEIYGEIASRESVLKEIYFQLGFIAGTKFSEDFEKKYNELNQFGIRNA